MKTHAILSVLGADRIGIASDLAATLKQRGLEIERSRMAALGGRFAVLMDVSGEEGSISDLTRSLDTLGVDLGFALRVDRQATPDATQRSPHAGRHGSREVLIESFGSQPSELNAITGTIKRSEVNIEEMETEVLPAPCTSDVTFHMKARLSVPESVSLESLEEQLHRLEQDRDLDIMIKRRPRRTARRLEKVH